MFGRRKKGLVAAGAPAPAFRLVGVDAGQRSLEDILAGGPTLLAFYKISCPVCQLTAPYLERLAANSALQVIGISQDDAGATREFIERFGVTFPTLLDLAWPALIWFTNRIFAEDREIVEMEQAAYDSQGADWNQEVFPAIRDLRTLLIANGQPANLAAATHNDERPDAR